MDLAKELQRNTPKLKDTKTVEVEEDKVDIDYTPENRTRTKYVIKDKWDGPTGKVFNKKIQYVEEQTETYQEMVPKVNRRTEKVMKSVEVEKEYPFEIFYEKAKKQVVDSLKKKYCFKN